MFIRNGRSRLHHTYLMWVNTKIYTHRVSRLNHKCHKSDWEEKNPKLKPVWSDPWATQPGAICCKQGLSNCGIVWYQYLLILHVAVLVSDIKKLYRAPQRTPPPPFKTYINRFICFKRHRVLRWQRCSAIQPFGGSAEFIWFCRFCCGSVVDSFGFFFFFYVSHSVQHCPQDFHWYCAVSCVSLRIRKISKNVVWLILAPVFWCDLYIETSRPQEGTIYTSWEPDAATALFKKMTHSNHNDFLKSTQINCEQKENTT